MRVSSSVSSAKRKLPEGTGVLLTSDSSRRARSGTAKDKAPAIEQANKASIKRRVREVIHNRRFSEDYRTIYVGNLSPCITKEDLHQKFSSCGPIVDIQLRCSQGSLTAVAKPSDNSYFSDVHYASILFTQYSSGHNALRLDGSDLRGCQLIVSASVACMPEVEQSVEYQITKLLTGEEPLDRPARRPVQAEKTEIIALNHP